MLLICIVRPRLSGAIRWVIFVPPLILMDVDAAVCLLLFQRQLLLPVIERDEGKGLAKDYSSELMNEGLLNEGGGKTEGSILQQSLNL